jgi:diacylglycerol kinase (ATP)
LAEPVYVVFNPASGKGRGAQLVAPVLAALSRDGGRVEHGLTARAGDEPRLVAEALAKGVRSIVAVGGDGTWGNVADAILRSGAPARLGFVPGGTGCDFAKSLGIPQRDVAACARIVQAGHARRVDVGRIEGRHFLNVAGFGFDTAVIEDSWRVRWLSGGALYVYCALRQLHAYRGFSVELAAGGDALERHELMMLILANGRVFGGGFQIAPRASLGDGQLDLALFGNLRPARRLPLMLRLLRGTHETAREVRTARGASWRLRFASPPAFETDGEWNQARSLELTVEALPAALEVLAPPA